MFDTAVQYYTTCMDLDRSEVIGMSCHKKVSYSMHEKNR